MTYRLSTDYDALFDAISAGEAIAAFVNYTLSDPVNVHQDICLIKRHGPYQISMAVRGLSYGGVYPFDEEYGEERVLFARQCEALSLKWILP